jgi:hypothetical protein
LESIPIRLKRTSSSGSGGIQIVAKSKALLSPLMTSCVLMNSIKHHLLEGMTRRQALKLTGGTVAASAIGSGAATASDPDESGGSDFNDAKLFDNHIHITPAPTETWEAFPADAAIEWMNENGIDKAVLLPLESPTSWSLPIPSWWVLEEAKKYPDRFIPYCAVAPQLADQFGEDRIFERIE